MVHFKIKCLECDKHVANSNNVLGRHLRKEHGIDYPNYIVKYEYDGIWPICQCGCGEKLQWKKGGFSKFLRGHGNKGENNGMFGKRGKDSPNYGKTRTAEHRKKYSKAASKRWRDDYDKRIAALNTEQYKRKQKVSQKRSYETTDRRDRTSKSVNSTYDCATTYGKQLRAAASERAINLLEQGKIGPQAPYKTEWKWNPFTHQEEYMHSSYESAFLDECIASNLPVTKKHDLRIPYQDPNGVERVYVPDFVALEDKEIFETKGWMNEFDESKKAATQEWCNQNGCRYTIVGIR